MSEAQIRAVVSDMDGTLLSRYNAVHPRDVETVRRLRAQGVRFWLASGRHARLVQPYIEQLGGVDGAVLSNGAYVRGQDGRTIRHNFFAPQDADEIWSLLGRLGAKRFFYAREWPCFLRDDARLCPPCGLPFRDERPFLRAGTDYRLMEELGDFPRAELELILAFFVPGGCEGAFRAALERFELACYPKPEGWFHAEISPRGCGKLAGVRALAESAGLDMSEVLALGDGPNDLALLRAAGFAAIPSGAQIAGQVDGALCTTDHDDAPLTAAMRRFLPALFDD